MIPAGYSMTVDTSKLQSIARGDVLKRKLPGVLANVGIAAQAAIIKRLSSGIFKNSSGNIEKSIKFRVEADKMRVVVYSDPRIAPYAKWQEKGVHAHPMTYLVNKSIPFVVINAQFSFAGRGSSMYGAQGVQFRRATPEALARGKFRHPGYEGKKFFRQGIQDAVAEINTHFKQLQLSVVFPEGE